jgi:hypothetical protein
MSSFVPKDPRKGMNGGQFSPFGSQALQILSMRLPGTLGGKPIAPESLLQPSVSRGAGAGAVGSTLAQTTGNVSGTPTPAAASPATVPDGVSVQQPPQGAASPFEMQQPDTTALANLVSGAIGGSASPPPNIIFSQAGGGGNTQDGGNSGSGVLDFLGTLFGRGNGNGGFSGSGGGTARQA